MNSTHMRRVLCPAALGLALLWSTPGHAVPETTTPILPPAAQGGFERLETLANVEGLLGPDTTIAGIAITGEGATIDLRVATGARHELRLVRPGAGPPVGHYFALAPPELATVTLAVLQPRLADALDRAFADDPWRLPAGQATTPAAPEGSPGPGFWHIGLAMLAILAVVTVLILR